MGKQWNEYTKNCALQHVSHLTQQQSMYILCYLRKIATHDSFALSTTRTFKLQECNLHRRKGLFSFVGMSLNEWMSLFHRLCKTKCKVTQLVAYRTYAMHQLLPLCRNIFPFPTVFVNILRLFMDIEYCQKNLSKFLLNIPFSSTVDFSQHLISILEKYEISMAHDCMQYQYHLENP